MEYPNPLEILETKKTMALLLHLFEQNTQVSQSIARKMKNNSSGAKKMVDTLHEMELITWNPHRQTIGLSGKGKLISQLLNQIVGILWDKEGTENSLANYEWLITEEKLVKKEITAEVDEIWLVTNDLEFDIPGGNFFEVVKANIARGIQYTYFVAENLQSKGRTVQLMHHHQNTPSLRIVNLDDSLFMLNKSLDYVIYDPYNMKNRRECWMCLPTLGTGDLHYHCRINDEMVDILLGVLGRILGK